MAHRFIAGETPELAAGRLRDLSDVGVAYTVDLLGEATLSEQEADVYFERYAALIRTLAEQSPGPATGIWSGVAPVNVSVKLSALCSHFEPAAPEQVSRVVRGRLLPLLRLARHHGGFVNVDMEQYAFRDLVQTAFADAAMEPELRDYADLGIVVQAYLKSAEDSIDFLKDLARRRGTPITIRLVKGAYWDEERIVADQNSWPVPVYEAKEATDASYERCTDRLFDAWPHLRPAFGTHNPRSVAQAITKSRSRGIDSRVEFQMLFGMAETLREAVGRQGFRTRVYVPVGAVIPGMAYLVRRLLENTSNQSWFMTGSNEATPDAIIRPPKSQQTSARSGGHERDGFRNSAAAEFHEVTQRRAMEQALDGVRSAFGRTQPLLLASGKLDSRASAEVRCPAHPSMLLGRVAQAQVADVDEALNGGRRSFEMWRDLGPARRGSILREAASLMERRRFDLAALMVYESGKPWREADGDVAEACDYLRYYTDEAERLMAPQTLGSVLGEKNFYLREARGVAAVIAPWNFPLAIITGMTAGALATGNCAIVKPAEQSPLIAAKLVEILREAGVPDGVVQYLPGSGESIGRALVEHPGVDTIAFTGSKEVGLSIIEAAARVKAGQRNVKRVIAEMGGKNAMIIDEDADIDQVVAGVVTSAFGYAGQKCSACSRLIVVGSAYSEVENRLAAAVESLVVGPPEEPATVVPPVISGEARARIERYISEGKRTARMLVQGSIPGSDGYYVAPTVFVDVDPSSALAREEIFGPVLSTFHVTDMKKALALALDSDFALTGGLYSRNPRSIESARQAFRTGNLYINRKITGAAVGRQAFGGLRMSGIGDKAGGPDYLLQFLSPRVVTENTARRGFAPGDSEMRG
jgi:RHH-type proline utilization regulon transcriptional repressor/proline dehydrogenase/delta 1-pyrroline-5-carboxylate dehydrogenase